MTQREDERAGPVPRFRQRWLQLGRTIIGQDRVADIACTFQRETQTEIGVRVGGLEGDRAAERGDRLMESTGLEASETEIVLDRRVGRIKQRGLTQRLDRFARSSRLKLLDGSRDGRGGTLRSLRHGRDYRLPRLDHNRWPC